MNTFADTLNYGKIGESRIATWLKSCGYSVLPVYNVEVQSGKGPRLFTPTTQLIAPDLFVFSAAGAYWVEVKHKSAFSWHRNSEKWVTGIDLCHYLDYCKIAEFSPFPVKLIFLHDGGQAKGSPPNSPVGLFGNDLSYLQRHENHRSLNWGKSGMVYWAVDDLIRYA